MSTATLRIGFAGAGATHGWAKDAHLAAVRAIPGLEIAAVSAREQSLADEAAAVFGARRAFADSEAMARDPAIDIVAVTVKVPEHRRLVLAALAAGKHVYCEWPLGRDLAEAEEMAAAARQSGTHVAIGLQGLQAPAIRHAAGLVRDGAVGRPLSLRVTSATAGWGATIGAAQTYLQHRRNGATLSTITGGHTLAAIEAVVGRYADVSAIGSIQRDTVRIAGSDTTVARDAPDHLFLLGRHDGGCVSSVEVIGDASDVPFRFELRGTGGRLTIGGHHPGGYQVGHLTVDVVPAREPQPSCAVPGLRGGAINVAEAWTAFASDIRAGTHTVPDFADAVRLTRLLDAIDAASDEGRRVSLEN